jgi:uncharacterized protein with GYD domain
MRWQLLWAGNMGYNGDAHTGRDALSCVKEENMPGHITLVKLTQQGVSKVKDMPAFIKEGKALAEKMGIRVVGVWMTLGQYDMVLIGDAPDDKTKAAFLLALASQGNITTETMRAFSEDEIEEVLRKLP